MGHLGYGSLPVLSITDEELNRTSSSGIADIRMPNNTTTMSGSEDSSTSGSMWKTALSAAQAMILVFSVGGNLVTLLILYLYKQRRKKLTRMYLFMLHLSLADLAVGLFNVTPMLFFIVNQPEPSIFYDSMAACKIVNFLSVVSIYASTYVLVMTALDRFLAICFPFSAQRLADKHAHSMAAFAWTLAIVFSIPQLIVFNYSTASRGCYTQWHSTELEHLRFETVYLLWFVSAVWILPTITIAACYISITVTVWNRGNALLNRGSYNMSSATANATRASRKPLLKPVQLTLAVVIGYLVCWSPWMVSMLILEFSNTKISDGFLKLSELFAFLIGFNSCLNPWIYLCFNYQSFRRLVTDCCGRDSRGVQNYTTNTATGVEMVGVTSHLLPGDPSGSSMVDRAVCTRDQEEITSLM